jgi:predicted RNA-binding protein YlxR (DUF448 family)
VNLAAASEDTAMTGSRSRRCIVTGEILPEARLLRFVASPSGEIVPDVEGKLPGRGIWVRSERDAVDTAVKKQLFARAAKAAVTAGVQLANLAEVLLVGRMQSHIGLARKAGELILGFDPVERSLRGETPPAVVVEAVEAAADGQRKLLSAAVSRGVTPFVMGALRNAELSLAVGRENVVHAALTPGRIAERLIFDAGRLAGFRSLRTWVWPGFSGGAVVAPG